MDYKKETVIYWTLLPYGAWSLYLAATSKGLCYVGTPNMPFKELNDWAKKRIPDSVLISDEEKLKPYTKEILEYLRGERRVFTIPIDFQGTPFQITVWKGLCEIPFGQTQSYSDIAKLIRKPNSVRAVGTAIGANPVLIRVPCHRVIGKNGSLTGYRGGLEMKTQLLQLERDAK